METEIATDTARNDSPILSKPSANESSPTLNIPSITQSHPTIESSSVLDESLVAKASPILSALLEARRKSNLEKVAATSEYDTTLEEHTRAETRLHEANAKCEEIVSMRPTRLY
jgi:hypothetical protein